MTFDEWWKQLYDAGFNPLKLAIDDPELKYYGATRQACEKVWNAGYQTAKGEPTQGPDKFYKCEVCGQKRACDCLAHEAAPTQEPVAWVFPKAVADLNNTKFIATRTRTNQHTTPLYTTLPDAAAQIAELETKLANALNLVDELTRTKAAPTQTRTELLKEFAADLVPPTQEYLCDQIPHGDAIPCLRCEPFPKPAPTQEHAKCDGNHGGPRCADPECWNDDSAPTQESVIELHLSESGIITGTNVKTLHLSLGWNKFYLHPSDAAAQIAELEEKVAVGISCIQGQQEQIAALGEDRYDLEQANKRLGERIADLELSDKLGSEREAAMREQIAELKELLQASAQNANDLAGEHIEQIAKLEAAALKPMSDDDIWDAWCRSHGNTEFAKAKAFARSLGVPKP